MSIRIITVSREFGSGGRTIGKEVADRLGWTYYDNELVNKIAKESGLAESYILESGEHACSTNSFLFNWAINAEAMLGTLPDSSAASKAGAIVLTGAWMLVAWAGAVACAGIIAASPRSSIISKLESAASCCRARAVPTPSWIATCSSSPAPK